MCKSKIVAIPNNESYEEKTRIFVSTAKIVHGNLYDYSKSIYTTSKSNLTIICSKHGEFEQTPAHHIHRKNGCSRCNGGGRGSSESFLELATEVIQGSQISRQW